MWYKVKTLLVSLQKVASPTVQKKILNLWKVIFIMIFTVAHIYIMNNEFFMYVPIYKKKILWVALKKKWKDWRFIKKDAFLFLFFEYPVFYFKVNLKTYTYNYYCSTY